MQESKVTGLKKRQLIQNAARTMFIWVAIASVAISFCAVASQFLYKQWEFNNKVYSAKAKASRTLSSNIINAKELQKEINALTGNQDLSSIKVNPDDTNTKIVLDALPGKYDTPALATSLQQAILGRSGISIESINVPTSSAVDSDGLLLVDADAQPVPQQVSMVVTGTYDKIDTLLKDLERSIRPMKVVSVNITGSDSSMRAAIDLTTHYQPSKTVNIKKQAVKQ